MMGIIVQRNKKSVKDTLFFFESKSHSVIVRIIRLLFSANFAGNIRLFLRIATNIESIEKSSIKKICHVGKKSYFCKLNNTLIND